MLRKEPRAPPVDACNEASMFHHTRPDDVNLGFGAIIEALFVTLFHTPVNADDNVYVDTWRWLRFL